jgi:hypothetical protein
MPLPTLVNPPGVRLPYRVFKEKRSRIFGSPATVMAFG